jgi:hypothetical protein
MAFREKGIIFYRDLSGRRGRTADQKPELMEAGGVGLGAKSAFVYWILARSSDKK